MHRISHLPAFLTCLLALASAVPAASQGGTPPFPVCGESFILGIAETITPTTTGGTFDVHALVSFSLLDFPTGFGACPPGPYSVDITVAATCTPSGDGAGEIKGVPLVKGFNTFTVPVTLPAGVPRRCKLSGTATTALSNGVGLSATATSIDCVGSPSPGNTSVPLLELQLLGGPGNDIVLAHPGDSHAFTFEAVNNSDETWNGDFVAGGFDEDSMPDRSGPMPPGTGPFSRGNPVPGLFPPVVRLALDHPPTLSASDNLIQTGVSVPPHSSEQITVYARFPGVSDRASMAGIQASLTGTLGSAPADEACASSVFGVDPDVAPGYSEPTNGQAADVVLPVLASLAELTMTGEVRPGKGVALLLSLVLMLLKVDGVDASPPIVFTGEPEPNRGRIQGQFIGPFGIGAAQPLEMHLGLVIKSDNGDTTSETRQVFPPSMPTGFEGQAPIGDSWTAVSGVSDPGLDSFFQVRSQTYAVGIDSLGNRWPITFGSIQFVLRADGTGVDLILGDGAVEPGAGSILDAIEVEMDLRGFLSPEIGGAVIFEDGFESGNTSRWSLSNP